MIAVQPKAELGQMFDSAGGSGKPRIGQIALSYDPDPQIAVKRAMDQFRWFTAGWRVNAELPLPASFDEASHPCARKTCPPRCPAVPMSSGTWPAIREFETAGFTHIALVQVGAETQEQFIAWAASELLPALRAS